MDYNNIHKYYHIMGPNRSQPIAALNLNVATRIHNTYPVKNNANI